MAADTANPAQPVVSLTPDAVRQVRLMIEGDAGNAGKCLRVYVEEGGCSGMQHAMTFDEKREGDFVAEFDGVPVVVDRVSAEHLRGTQIDFSDALTGGGFKVNIPRAQASCGCGKSFAT